MLQEKEVGAESGLFARGEGTNGTNGTNALASTAITPSLHHSVGALLCRHPVTATSRFPSSREMDLLQPGLLHELFERQADLRPDATALECAGARMTYGELERRSNQLARLLRQHGVGRGVSR
jgi:non-ribosomal peptide synthetase component F